MADSVATAAAVVSILEFFSCWKSNSASNPGFLSHTCVYFDSSDLLDGHHFSVQKTGWSPYAFSMLPSLCFISLWSAPHPRLSPPTPLCWILFFFLFFFISLPTSLPPVHLFCAIAISPAYRDKLCSTATSLFCFLSRSCLLLVCVRLLKRLPVFLLASEAGSQSSFSWRSFDLFNTCSCPCTCPLTHPIPPLYQKFHNFVNCIISAQSFGSFLLTLCVPFMFMRSLWLFGLI